MMFNSIKAIIFLRAHELQFYTSDLEKPARLKFAPDVLNHLELLNEEAFKRLLSEFIESLALTKQNVAIVLSEEVVFEKVIDLSNKDLSVDDQKNTFFDSVPLDPELTAQMSLENGNQVYLSATNSKVIEAIVDVLCQFEWEVKVASSVSVLGLSDQNNLTAKLVENILGSEKLLMDADFLKQSILLKDTKEKIKNTSREEVESEEDRGDNQTGSKLKQVLLLIFALLIFTGAVGYLVWNQGWIKLPFLDQKQVTSVIEALPSASPESTTSEEANNATTSATFDRASLRISVLNGTGVAGQAGKIRDELLALGYQEIEAGNSPESTNSSTVQFSSSLDKSLSAKIMVDLLGIIGNIEQATTSAELFDMIVNVGSDAVEE